MNECSYEEWTFIIAITMFVLKGVEYLILTLFICHTKSYKTGHNKIKLSYKEQSCQETEKK